MPIKRKSIAEIMAEPDITEAQPREVTDSLLTGLEELAKKAYPHEWLYAVDGDTHVVTGDDLALVECNCAQPPIYESYAVDNAKYIAAAQPSVILGMIAKMRELEEFAEEVASNYAKATLETKALAHYLTIGKMQGTQESKEQYWMDFATAQAFPKEAGEVPSKEESWPVVVDVPKCKASEATIFYTSPDSQYPKDKKFAGSMLICDRTKAWGSKSFDVFDSSLGACCADYSSLPKPQQLIKLLVEVLQAIVRDGIAPKVAVRALTNVEELACVFANDVYGSLALPVPTEEQVEDWHKAYNALFDEPQAKPKKRAGVAGK